MSFLRHVGKVGDRKVAIIFRQVPGEPHMALVTYTETLNRHIHDPMIKCIESDIGQNSKDLADALKVEFETDKDFTNDPEAYTLTELRAKTKLGRHTLNETIKKKVENGDAVLGFKRQCNGNAKAWKLVKKQLY